MVERAYEPWVEVIGRRPRPMDDDYSKLLAELRLLTHELMASNLTLYKHLGWREFEPDEPEAALLTYFRKPVSA